MVLSFKMDDWEMPDDEQANAFFESEDEFERSQTYEHFRFTADKKQTPIRIDKFLTDRLPHTSRMYPHRRTTRQKQLPCQAFRHHLYRHGVSAP